MDYRKLALALAVSAALAGCSDDDSSNPITCDEGEQWNEQTQQCEIIPVEPIECDEGEQWNEETQQCEVIPTEPNMYDSANWQEAFPEQYASWASTIDNTPAEGPHDLLADNPNLVAAWAGYGFAKSYAKARGHAFALTDVIKSLRTGAPMKDMDGNITGEAMKASCWSCKTPDVPRLFEEVGENAFADNGWSVWGEEMNYTIGCADCHELGEDKLRISRAYANRAVEAIGRPFDAQAHGEQTNQACAQCHVEYYFDGTNSKRVHFPWDHWVPGVDTDYSGVENLPATEDAKLYQGFAAEAQLAYYDSIGFKDWTNAISGAPMLKTQHPEYENLADRNEDTITSPAFHLDLTCSDCHMPQTDDVSSHNVSFELAANCTGCHSAEAIDGYMDERKAVLEAMRFGDNGIDPRLTEVHFKAQAIWAANGIEGLEAGKTIGEAKAAYEGALAAGDKLAGEMNSLLTKVRYAQWFWDSATASHGIHAHNFEEAKRLLTKANGYLTAALTEADALLATYAPSYQYDATLYDTKEEIQPLAGLNLEAMQDAKDTFITERVEKDWPVELQTP